MLPELDICHVLKEIAGLMLFALAVTSVLTFGIWIKEKMK